MVTQRPVGYRLDDAMGRALSSQHHRATHPHGPNGPRRAQDGRTPRPSTPLPQSTIPSSPVPVSSPSPSRNAHPTTAHYSSNLDNNTPSSSKSTHSLPLPNNPFTAAVRSATSTAASLILAKLRPGSGARSEKEAGQHPRSNFLLTGLGWRSAAAGSSGSSSSRSSNNPSSSGTAAGFFTDSSRTVLV
ncbi:MAG: hypothetical protein WDW38_009814 [Sanguina aurantia]